MVFHFPCGVNVLYLKHQTFLANPSTSSTPSTRASSSSWRDTSSAVTNRETEKRTGYENKNIHKVGIRTFHFGTTHVAMLPLEVVVNVRNVRAVGREPPTRGLAPT